MMKSYVEICNMVELQLEHRAVRSFRCHSSRCAYLHVQKVGGALTSDALPTEMLIFF